MHRKTAISEASSGNERTKKVAVEAAETERIQSMEDGNRGLSIEILRTKNSIIMLKINIKIYCYTCITQLWILVTSAWFARWVLLANREFSFGLIFQRVIWFIQILFPPQLMFFITPGSLPTIFRMISLLIILTKEVKRWLGGYLSYCTISPIK